MKLNPEKYLRYILLPGMPSGNRTRNILHTNPTIIPVREEAVESVITVYDYDLESLNEYRFSGIEETFPFVNNKNRITWINIDGLRKSDVEAICNQYNVHRLLTEDILSVNQRPKMDEIEGVLFCLLNMLYYNPAQKSVETEQVSIVLGEGFVISFQEDPKRDVFDPIRQKLKMPKSNLRQRTADYLSYSLIDIIVDNYFLVMEKLGDEIELLEEEVIRRSTKQSLARINQLRKELIVLKRNITPVRDLINGIIRSESELLNDRTTKYYKDVYDHVAQAHDLSENYRDIMMSMQDLYINNVNLKMNEVMKVLAIVTCILAPATVIGGIFGMNFDRIPYLHHQYGFFIAVALMLIIPLYMLLVFKRRGWF